MKKKIQLVRGKLRRIRLEPDEMLLLTFQSDDIDNSDVQRLRLQLKKVFPKNRVGILCVGANDKVDACVIKEQLLKDLETAFAAGQSALKGQHD